MDLIGLLNSWSMSWSALMARVLIDASVLLTVVLLIWLPLRRRMSSQVAHGLFFLVLLKLLVPVPVSWPSWSAGPSLRQAAERFSAWASVDPSAARKATPEPAPAIAIPLTGDLGPAASDGSSPQPIVVEEPVGPADAPAPVSAEARVPLVPGRAVRARLSVQALAMLGWAGIASLLLWRFVRALRSTSRLIRAAQPLDPEWLPIDLEALRRAAGVRVPVRWAISPLVHSPAVGGLLRPTVVIPPDLEEDLTPKQLSWVLLHELAHVRRLDLWVVAVQRIVQAAFFFHPAVHVANWIMDQLREYACDDMALASSKASRLACGEGFLTIVGRTVDRATPTSTALGLFESRMLIRRRLLRILDERRTVHASLSPGALAGLLAVGLVVLPYGKPRDASAYPQGASLGNPALRTIAGGLETEPATYRPGLVLTPGRREALVSPGAARSEGTRGMVHALAYSPDGTRLASSGEDATIVLRNAATGQVLSRLEGHADAVSCVAFAPDGRTLASGSYDRTVRLWDLAGGAPPLVLQGHDNWVSSLAFSPGGKTLASAGYDKTVRLWDVASGRPSGVLDAHASAIRALAFAPDGQVLASAGGDRVVAIWDVATRSRRSLLEGHKGAIRALAFAPGGTLLASASEDAEVRLWDLAFGRERAVLTGHGDMVACLAFSPRGTTLATGSLDSTVKLWDPRTGRERTTLAGHADGVTALAFGPHASQLATGGYDGTIRLWEPATPVFSPGACLTSPGEVQTLAFAPDGRTLLASGEGSPLVRWDVRTGALLAKDAGEGGSALAFAPDGRVYASAGRDRSIQVYEAASGRRLASFPGDGVRSLSFSPDGKTLACGGGDGILRTREARGGRALRTFPAMPGPITCVRYAPDGKTLASATGVSDTGVPGTVSLWDVATGSLRGTLGGHKTGLVAIGFAPDGKTLASAGEEGLIRLWELASLSVRVTLKYAGCHALAFSGDGRYLASAHRGEVVLWDAQEGRQLAFLKGHSGEVLDVAFAPDGRSLATAGKDRTVKLWSLASRRLTSRAALKGDMGCVVSLAYSPNGRTLAAADATSGVAGVVTLWDLASRRPLATLEGHMGGVTSVVFAPDGQTLASGGTDGTIRIWDAETGEERDAFSGLGGATRLAYAPDGKTLVSVGEDRLLTLWDVASGTEIARFADYRWRILCVAFSADGQLLATGGGGVNGEANPTGEVRVWNVARRTEVARLEGHSRAVIALAFAPDGRTLATGGADASVRLWDLQSGRARLTLDGFTSWIQALAFSKDGRILASSGRGDGGVSLLDARTGDEVARLVGHGASVRGIVFAPDGRSLATGALDRTVRLWDVPTTRPSVAARR